MNLYKRGAWRRETFVNEGNTKVKKMYDYCRQIQVMIERLVKSLNFDKMTASRKSRIL